MKITNTCRSKILLLHVILLFTYCPAFAQSTQTHNQIFTPSDFIFKTLGDTLFIHSNKHNLIFENDPSKPAIPFVGINILIPESNDITSFSYTVKSQINLGTFYLGNNNSITRRDNIETNQHSVFLQYDTSIVYPLNQYSECKVNIIDGYKIASVAFSPFVYDATTKSLSLLTSVDFTINTHLGKRSISSNDHKGVTMCNTVRDIIINSDDLPILYPNKNRAAYNDYGSVNYLIVTTDSLRESFTELLEWKRLKGLRADVITTEEIDSTYIGNHLYEKIKACLYDYYQNKRLSYVLLGGDNNIIPAVSYYMNLEPDDLLPTPIVTDSYFASFGENDGFIYLDSNNNGKINVKEHETLAIIPSIFVSRLPLRTSNEIKNYISNLLCYEFDYNSMRDYYENVLFGGCEALFYDSIIGKSDVNIYGNIIYEEEFENLTTPNSTFLYDTESSRVNKSFNTSDLEGILSEGFHLINIDTHGTNSSWVTEDGKFDTNNALSLNSPSKSIIVTGACYTNDFTSDSTCLSEAFLKNPNSGVIAYIGGTGAGLGFYNIDESHQLGPSAQYAKLLYNQIISNERKGLCEATAYAKSIAMLSSFFNSGYANQWIAASTNIMGDPEFQVHFPYKTFNHTSFTLYNTEEAIIESNVDSCTITFKSEYDNSGQIEYDVLKGYSNMDKTLFQDNNITQICITKDGYIPILIGEKNNIPVNQISFQNSTINRKLKYSANNIQIGTYSTQDEEVVIEVGGALEFNKTKNAEIMNFTCKKGATLSIVR